MTSKELYISTHFRSLLISRFLYSKVDSIIKIKSIKIIAMVPPSHYELVCLSMYISTGVWPTSQIYQKKKWGKGGKYQLLVLINRITNRFMTSLGYFFLWKLSSFYFPCVDAADKKADYVFVIKGVTRNTSMYSAPYLIESIVEMDFLVSSSSKLLRALSKFWQIKWLFSTTAARSLAEHTAPLRACAFGSIELK